MPRRATLALGLLLSIPIFAYAEAGESARFGVRGELRPVASSPDRRFALSGQARVTAPPTSADGRFGLSDVLLICIPSTLIGVLAGALSVSGVLTYFSDFGVFGFNGFSGCFFRGFDLCFQEAFVFLHRESNVAHGFFVLHFF